MEAGLAGRRNEEGAVKKKAELDPGLGGNSLKAAEVMHHLIPAGGQFPPACGWRG